MRVGIALVGLGLLLGQAGAGGASARPARHATGSLGAAGTRSASCAVTRIGFLGSARISAATSCRLDGHTIPSLTTWSVQYEDAPGAPCSHLGVTSGKGTSFSLPATSADWQARVLPAITEATFTVRATAAGHAIRATRTWRNVDTTSRILCSAPPPLTATRGPAAPVCAFASAPSLRDGVVRVAGVKCAGGKGSCHWRYRGPKLETPFLTYSYDIVCAGAGAPTVSEVNFSVAYKADSGAATCAFGPGSTGGTLRIPSDWGAGSVQVTATVDNARWRSRSVRVKGTTDACSDAFPGEAAVPALVGTDLTLSLPGMLSANVEVRSPSDPNTSCGHVDAFSTGKSGTLQSGSLAGNWRLRSSSVDVIWVGGSAVQLARGDLGVSTPARVAEHLTFNAGTNSCPVTAVTPQQTPIGLAYPIVGSIGPPSGSTQASAGRGFFCGFATLPLDPEPQSIQSIQVRLQITHAIGGSAYSGSHGGAAGDPATYCAGVA